jgi:hypothetical protein
VDRELEAVCLKCLQHDPSGRYGLADALANDTRRWLRMIGRAVARTARDEGLLDALSRQGD